MVDGPNWTELAEGDQFAGYRIERRLGRGGMGILYLAVEPGLDRRVALKLILPEAAADEVFAKRFAEESRIAASIEHPNVVPIYAAGEEAGVPFIAMRFVPGSDLGRRLEREGRLGPEQAVALIAQVANGLDAIHAAGLVHRDVKPANVLLSGEEGAEHAYITDFGVARNVATQSGLTQTGRFVGTLDYVAPEQISGGAIDARVDVYALGCLLFKLLSGQVPFPREGEAARLYAHLNDPPPSPSLYVPEVPMALDDVVVRAMSKQPEDRYPSAGDLGRAALASLSGGAVPIPERTVATGAAATVDSATRGPEPAEPPTEATGRLDPEKPGAPSGSRRRPFLIGGVLAVAVIVVLAVVLASGGGGNDPSTSADKTLPVEEKAGGDKNQNGGGEEKSKVPETLTMAQLIKKGDAICATSQATYSNQAKPRHPNGEHEPNVEYSEELMAISTRAVGEFRQLDPPPGLAADYQRYLTAQEEVKDLDAQALSAAQNGDAVAYEAARISRDEGQPERHEMAQAIGFKVCSASPE